MKTLVLSTLALLLVSLPHVAQSRPAGTPTPTPANARQGDDSEERYSESKPTDGPTYSRHRKPGKPGDIRPTVDTSVIKAAGDDVIKIETNLISIPVSVYERSGVYMSGLSQSDFHVFEDGKEQEVAYFGTTDVPFSVVLLIDKSGSTDTRARDIRNAALEFVH